MDEGKRLQEPPRRQRRAENPLMQTGSRKRTVPFDGREGDHTRAAREAGEPDGNYVYKLGILTIILVILVVILIAAMVHELQ